MRAGARQWRHRGGTAGAGHGPCLAAPEDLFGERLFAHLQRNGVDMRLVQRCSAPSTLAFVERGEHTNRYAFYMQGTADTLWAPAELPKLPDECRILQFGSIALHAPAGPRILDLVAAQRGRRLIVFDPNVRPTLIRDAQAFRRDCLDWLALADLVKLSDEDAAFIAPGQPVLEAAGSWLSRGPRAVVLTQGPRAPPCCAQTALRCRCARLQCRWRTPSARATPLARHCPWRCSSAAWSRRSS